MATGAVLVGPAPGKEKKGKFIVSVMQMMFRNLRHVVAGGALAFSLGAHAQVVGPYEGYGRTAGEQAVGRVLDGSAPLAGSDRAAMMQSLAQLPTASQRADALGQLSARSYTLLPRLATQSMDGHDRQLRDYLVERRAIAADAPADVPASGPGTITMMLTGDLMQGHFNGRTDRPAATMDSRALRFAIDVRPIPNLLIGATIGIEGIDARLDREKRPRITDFNAYVGPYASYSNGKFYVDMTTGYNFAEYRLRRQVSWAGFDNRLTSNGMVEGDGWAATAETGALLRAGRLRVQPFAGLLYRYADVEASSERGGAAALEVAAYNRKSWRASLGSRISTTIDHGKWSIRPALRAEWQHELRGQPESRIEARFASRDTAIFTLRPTSLVRDAGLVGASVTATHASRTSVRLGYNGEFSGDRSIHNFALTLSRRF